MFHGFPPVFFKLIMFHLFKFNANFQCGIFKDENDEEAEPELDEDDENENLAEDEDDQDEVCTLQIDIEERSHLIFIMAAG